MKAKDRYKIGEFADFFEEMSATAKKLEKRLRKIRAKTWVTKESEADIYIALQAVKEHGNEAMRNMADAYLESWK